MSNTIGSISISGIQAGFKRLEVSADNVARRPVNHSEKRRVIQEDIKGGGVTTQVKTIPLPEHLTSEENRFYDSSNIDYAEESIEQTSATVATKVALRAYETAQSFEETILSIGDKKSG